MAEESVFQVNDPMVIAEGPPKRVFIFDTTLRDGEQAPGAALHAAAKMQIAEALVEANVDLLEAGNPISAGDFAPVRAIAERFGTIAGGPMIVALARCVEADVEAVLKALEPAGNEKGVPHVYIGVSPDHLEGQLKKSGNEVLKMIMESVSYAKSGFTNVQFSPMDAVRADVGYLYDVIHAAIEAGSTIINIPDTVGYTTPLEFIQLIWNITQNVPNIALARLSVHCHDDLGMAVANSLMAIPYGATQIECTVNGTGERAGNAALEAIVMAIKTRRDFFGAYTDFVTGKLVDLSNLVSELMGFPVPPNKAIVGRNAFAHSSGVHQDGVLKRRSTFEIMNPEDVGREKSEIPLTSRSGRAALRHHIARYCKVADEQFGKAHDWFKMIAPHLREVGPSIVRDIVEMVVDAPEAFSLVSVSAGPIKDEAAPVPYKASLEVVYDGEAATWEGFGETGPVDAIVHAINLATGTNFQLLSCETESIGAGSDTIARAEVSLSYDGAYGHGVYFDTDTFRATAMAYAHAVLKAGKTGMVKTETELKFSPQRVGRYQELDSEIRYDIPDRPEAGFLVVGVGAGGCIGFFHTPVWKGGYYKSKRWTYHSIPPNAVSVRFRQYEQKKPGSRHVYGEPEFFIGI